MSRAIAAWQGALAVALLCACTEHESAPVVCASPNRTIAGRCLEPGVQDDGCPAGSLGGDDGPCQPAGIPPELCGEGFVHDVTWAASRSSRRRLARRESSPSPATARAIR
jgi:hypothetical protein